MPLLDTVNRTLQIKIVYYGPGLSGKTTNLEQLSDQLDPARTGDLVVLETTGDRTLFFDWMPLELGKIRGFDVQIQLYTVPGQVRYNNTRKRVLAAVDGIVFVADSQEEALDQNRFAFQNLRENLAETGVDLEEIPLVVQYNKRDLPSALGVDDLSSKLSFQNYPHTESVASDGRGILETLRLVTRVTLQHVINTLDPAAPETLQQKPTVPLDGEGLLEHIMAGEAADRAAKAEAAKQAAEAAGEKAAAKGSNEAQARSASPSSGFEVGWTEYSEGLAGRLESVESNVESTLERVDALKDRVVALEGGVAGARDKLRKMESGLPKLVKRESGTLEEGLKDVAARLETLQRLLNTLGGRMSAVERKVEQLANSGAEAGRSRQLAELSRLLRKMSAVLDQHASSLAPRAAPEPAAGTGDGSSGSDPSPERT